MQGTTLPAFLPPALAEAARAVATAAPPLAVGASSMMPTACSSSSGNGLLVPIAPSELAHYRAIFLTAEPQRGGGVSGEVGVRVFAPSGLPKEELARIWQLADLDADGTLTLEEFVIAMHLMRRRVAGHELPDTLPSVLRPPYSWGAAAKAADTWTHYQNLT